MATQNEHIYILHERYVELLKAEAEAERLKNLIHERAKEYASINYSELQLLNQLYFGVPESTPEIDSTPDPRATASVARETKIGFINESEENENGGK